MRTFLIFFPFWYAYNHNYIRRVAGRVFAFPRIYHYHTMRTAAPELFPLDIAGDNRQFAMPDESQFRPYNIKRAYVYGGGGGWTFTGQQEFKSLSDDDGEFVEKCRRYAPKTARLVNKAASIDKDEQEATRRVARWLPRSVVGGIQRIFGIRRPTELIVADRPLGTQVRFTMEERSRENEEEFEVRRGLRHRALRIQFRRPRDDLPSPFINSTEEFVNPWNLPWSSWYGREEEKSDSGSPMHRRPSPTLSSDSASLIGQFDYLAPYVEEVYVGPHRLGYRSRHASEFRDVRGTRFRSIRRQRLEGEVQIQMDERKRKGSPHRLRRREPQDERKVRFEVPPRRSVSVPPHFHSEDNIWQELGDIPSEDEEGWLEYMRQQRESAAWKRREGVKTPTSTPERQRSISSALAEALEVPRSLVTAVTGVSLLWSPRPGGGERTPTSSSPESLSEEKFRLRLDQKIRLNREFVRTLPLRLASITAANVPITRRDWPTEDSDDEASDVSISEVHTGDDVG
ncbi:MAG: uncharacterized protein KVP18_001544 [Porospora cf. gigantea A]|nr:MAG: hypothetical protein KVP18_001544 [Porospora cf. gigantea A]